MASINMDSILEKAKNYIGGKDGKNRVDNVVHKAMSGEIKLQSGDTIHTPEEAAIRFILVLRDSIDSSGLSENAIDAISNISYTTPYKTMDNRYLIYVYFADDMSRPSLDEEKYGRIEDIVALFNNGVDHTMRPVHGLWHGKDTWSRTVIPGTHFIEQAVSDFKGNYAYEYNVTDISVRWI